MLKPDIEPLQKPITYRNNIMLIGSCFTEHISDRLAQHKFKVLSNPHGILFNPLSVASSINSYIAEKQYTQEELFYLNELWNSWDHHTRFSDISAGAVLDKINQSQATAAGFIRNADWVIITLGSAFQYYLKEQGKPVANNHRAPAQWFEKRLLPISEITEALRDTIIRLRDINPAARVIFTISPVRHIRDGVTDNNRSKARLIESVHALCADYDHVHYFPAYELVIDVLRDYRYYDVDFVHPNYLATSFVWEQFVSSCIAPSEYELMQQVQDIATARVHRPRFPETNAHRRFMDSYAEKARQLMQQYPFLDMAEEIKYFSS